jgi:hypothetical protein
MQIPRCYRAVPLPLALLFAAACAEKPASAATSAAGDTVRHGVQASVVAAADTDTVAARVTRDSLRLAGDSIKLAAESAAVRTDSASPAKKAKVAEDSIRWPTDRPAPLPGALLPSHRIVAFYGNPLSKRMGILGELPPDQMMAKLERTAKEWAAADSTTTVKPALHLIVTVAQASPGRDGKHRLRMSDSLIERVARWAEERNWLLFLDVQIGQSTVRAELPRLMPYLRRPYVHLALDPEFAMRNGAKPGKRIGTMDASEINEAIDSLISVVDANQLPPKIMLVHRFTTKMLTNARKIRTDARAQVVIDMDGFGSPQLKRGTWKAVILREPVWYTGFKLFYKNDKPMLKPAEVLKLRPAPLYIQYQ